MRERNKELKEAEIVKDGILAEIQKEKDEMERNNKELLKDLEELKSAKLILDEKLVQLEASKLTIEHRNKALLKDLEDLKAAQLVIKLVAEHFSY